MGTWAQPILKAGSQDCSGLLPPDAQDTRAVEPIERENWDQWLHGSIEHARSLIRLSAPEVFAHGAADIGIQVLAACRVAGIPTTAIPVQLVGSRAAGAPGAHVCWRRRQIAPVSGACRLCSVPGGSMEEARRSRCSDIGRWITETSARWLSPGPAHAGLG